MLPDAQSLNASVLDAIIEARIEDPTGIARPNDAQGGAWHSHPKLHHETRFAMLARLIRDLADQLAEELGYTESAKLEIKEMWAIVNPSGTGNRAHVHPGALWSGVYYIQAEECAGNIEFTDPRTARIMTEPTYANRPAHCETSVSFIPVPGRSLAFPGWLYHSVQPNRSSADRVVVSFNLAWMR